MSDPDPPAAADEPTDEELTAIRHGAEKGKAHRSDLAGNRALYNAGRDSRPLAQDKGERGEEPEVVRNLRSNGPFQSMYTLSLEMQRDLLSYIDALKRDRTPAPAVPSERELDAWERRDLEMMIQNEHKLYRDAWERYLAAEEERAASVLRGIISRAPTVTNSTAHEHWLEDECSRAIESLQPTAPQGSVDSKTERTGMAGECERRVGSTRIAYTNILGETCLVVDYPDCTGKKRETLDGPTPHAFPALPIDREDERIVDELMAKHEHRVSRAIRRGEEALAKAQETKPEPDAAQGKRLEKPSTRLGLLCVKWQKARLPREQRGGAYIAMNDDRWSALLDYLDEAWSEERAGRGGLVTPRKP